MNNENLLGYTLLIFIFLFCSLKSLNLFTPSFTECIQNFDDLFFSANFSKNLIPRFETTYASAFVSLTRFSTFAFTSTPRFYLMAIISLAICLRAVKFKVPLWYRIIPFFSSVARCGFCISSDKTKP